MKILVTGFNALSIGTARSPLNIATSARILPTVLKELGHDVTHKAIIPGEDVSMYDKVFVFVFGPNSLSARYWYGAAYTIIKRPDAIVSIDDWQTKDSVSGFGTFSRGHWRIWKKVSQAGNPVGKVYWDEAQPYKKEIEDLVDTFAFEKWPHTLLVPAYDGGNYNELGIKANKIFENAFEWRFEFPEVLNDEGDFLGFDIVIGNPPYGSNIDELIKYFELQYPETVKGYKDIYKIFFNLGVELLKNEHGILSFITPNTLLLQPRYGDLRRYLLKFSLIEIVNLGEGVFEDATVPTVIIILNKNVNSNQLSFNIQSVGGGGRRQLG
jgi:hypothetical protein